LINNAVIGALSGGRNLNLNVGLISVGNNNTSTTYSGALTNSGSLTKIGAGTLTLFGTNTFAGKTTVSAGTLALSGNGNIASTNITVAGGAMFDVSGLNTAFVLGSNRTFTNSSVVAVINGTNNCSGGTLSLVTDGVNPSFTQTNGTMTISASTAIRVNNTGAILAAGVHPLITAATAGNLGKVTGALPSVVVAGNGASGAVSLQINGTGGLDLLVTSTISSSPTNLNFTISNGTLTLTWPSDHLGWIAQSNAFDLSLTNYWFDVLGSQSATNLVIPINPAAPRVFYRLRYP
jgi:autotransporter-associated beta strand protein